MPASNQKGYLFLMRKFTCPPTLELLGQNIIAWVNNIQGDETQPIMQKRGLLNLDADKWYPAQQFMEAFNDMAEHPNLVSNMVAIGMEIGRIVPLPPQLENPTLGDVLMAWNDMYQYIHRNGDAGQITCEKVTDTHYKVTLTDLYPDNFSYGIMYGYARRFLPQDVSFTVYYDPDLPQRDEEDADKTVIHLEWQ